MYLDIKVAITCFHINVQARQNFPNWRLLFERPGKRQLPGF
jgi:hypothetical protein